MSQEKPNLEDDQQPYRFRNLDGLTKVLEISLGVFMLVAAVSFFSDWAQIDLLQQAKSGLQITEAEVIANDNRQQVIGVLYFLVFMITAVLFARWTYLANKNARTMAEGMEYTPGWSVGWYFVPIANFWKPYQALKEIAKASNPEHSKDDWRQAERPEAMPYWWGLWIITGILGNILFRNSFSGDATIDSLLTTSWVMFISGILDILLGIVAILLIAKINEWQKQKHNQISAEKKQHKLSTAQENETKTSQRNNSFWDRHDPSV